MRWLTRLTQKQIVVHLTDDETVKGICVGVYTDCVVLKHAVYLDEKGSTAIDGEAVIPRSSISWVQNLPASEGI